MSRQAPSPVTLFNDGFAVWLTLTETMLAASAVIGARSKIIDRAITSPGTADLPELWRMGSEKMFAFGEAWLVAWSGCASLFEAAAAQGRDVERIMSSGRIVLPSDIKRLTDRSSRASAAFIRSSGNSLAPIHKTATGNARRFGSNK